jgi:hypothetical protein
MTQEIVALGIALFWIWNGIAVGVLAYAIRMKINDIKEKRELSQFERELSQFERTHVSSSEVENNVSSSEVKNNVSSSEVENNVSSSEVENNVSSSEVENPSVYNIR